ncbi:MAG: protein translocase subunit SecDF [Bacteroidales bacterium]|nr:protein translocase subunit SecDF [Bacteroidales bacterium]
MQNKGAIRLFAILLTLVSIYQLTFTFITNRVENTAKSFAQDYSYAEKAKPLIDSIVNSNGNLEVIDYCVNAIRNLQRDVLKMNEFNYLDSIQRAKGNMQVVNKFIDSLVVIQDELVYRKEKAYLDSMSNEVVYNFLWLRKFTYEDCKKRELNLGLDLKGGMNVTLEISVEDVIKTLAGPVNSKDPLFLEAMKEGKVKMNTDGGNFVDHFVEAFQRIGNGADINFLFQTSGSGSVITNQSTVAEVRDYLAEQAQTAIDNSFNILRNRIDKFGVTQPNIQRLEGNSGRVIVELPGIKNPERALKLLQSTAKLEFWETYENKDIFPYLKKVNDIHVKLNKQEKKPEVELPLLAEEKNEDNTGEELDTTSENDDVVSLFNEEDTIKNEKDTAKADLGLDDVDETEGGKIEDQPLFSILIPQIANNNQPARGPVVGMSLGQDTAKVMRMLNHEEAMIHRPMEVMFRWEYKPNLMKVRTDNGGEEEKEYYNLIALRKSTHTDKAPLEGDVITSASADYHGNSAIVYMSMNSEGATEWAKLTKKNIDHAIAIVMDGVVYSYPNVENEITGGSSQISGNFTIQEAKDLATLLNAGKMPAPAHVVSYEIVGPSLGKEAIDAGIMSFLFAFLLVMIYMVFYYSRRAGMVANFALIANLFFIFGVLASLGATLTLPGIAGIVLTIGMSVDANVLIYERIREEIAAGKGLKLAISHAYSWKGAMSAIIDANVTTILTGIILYTFGSGPIQGFATTLIIGILTSLFSAIFITRLFYDWFINKNWKITFDTKITRNAFKNLNIQFIEKRKTFYAISSIVIVIGLGSLFVNGLSLGIDFKGGRNYVVRFDKPVSPSEIKKSLKEVFGESPEVKTFGKSNQVKITTKYKIDDEGINIENEIDSLMFVGLKSQMSEGITLEKYKQTDETKMEGKMSSQKVGPTIVSEIKVSAIYSIVFSLLIMFLYILIRFRNWQFGLGATVALMHDVLFVLGLFSLLYSIMPFSMEIDQAFIAAILTVVGYSLNDTVVVFDRIREFAGIHTKRERKDIMNMAMNSTVSRTVNTSLTTFVVLLTIFIFGGEVIRGFTFALLVGIIVGTYSSLFVATPIVYDTIKRAEKIRVIKGKAIR